MNPSVLGGLVVDFGEKTIDLSVSSRINKLNGLLQRECQSFLSFHLSISFELNLCIQNPFERDVARKWVYRHVGTTKIITLFT